MAPFDARPYALPSLMQGRHIHSTGSTVDSMHSGRTGCGSAISPTSRPGGASSTWPSSSMSSPAHRRLACQQLHVDRLRADAPEQASYARHPERNALDRGSQSVSKFGSIKCNGRQAEAGVEPCVVSKATAKTKPWLRPSMDTTRLS